MGKYCPKRQFDGYEFKTCKLSLEICKICVPWAYWILQPTSYVDGFRNFPVYFLLAKFFMKYEVFF